MVNDEGEVAADVGTLEVSDAGVQEVADAPAEDTPTEDTPATAEAADEAVTATEPVVETPEALPLWTDEQWADWNGTKDTLDDRYHTIYDRLSADHNTAKQKFEQQLQDANRSIEALSFGDPDPQIDILREAAKAHEGALAEANERANAAEARILEIQQAHADEQNAKTETLISDFKREHAWAFEDGANETVNKAISELISESRGMLPVAAGNLFKGKPVKYQEALAGAVLRGADVESAKQLADFITKGAPPEKLPDALPGAEFVSGSTPAANTERRKLSQYEANSMKETRGQMAASMFS